MKWWISDYDGTLRLSQDHSIDLKDKKFISEWTENNEFILASGRLISDIKQISINNNWRCKYYISNNGGQVYDKKFNLISNTSIDLNDRIKLLEKIMSLKQQYSIMYCCLDKIETLSFVEVDSNLTNLYWPKGVEIVNWEHAVNEILYNEFLNTIYILSDEKSIKKIPFHFNEFNNIKVIETYKNTMEIINKSVSKKAAIDVVRSIENFASDDVVVTGDGENDFEMIRDFKYSFAMEGSKKEMVEVSFAKIKNVSEIKKYIKY